MEEERRSLVSGPGMESQHLGTDKDLGILRAKVAVLGRADERTWAEDDVVDALTLFLQVSQCCDTGHVDMQAVFVRAAEIVVAHIQQMLSQRPAEEARYQVEQFFGRKEEVRNSRGWVLLKSLSLSLMCADKPEEVAAVTATGLPSALAKCLYLFVTISPRRDTVGDEDTVASFQGIFIQVLVQPWRCPVWVEALLDTQELQSLLIALTSLWDTCTSSWRHQASHVLRAVSAARTRMTVPVLQEQNCLKICMQNLLKVPQDVPGPLLAEVAVTVFSFIRDSYPSSPVLFEEFERNEGYRVLQVVMARSEESVTSNDLQPMEEFVDLVASFTLFGKAELKVAVCINNPQPHTFKFNPALTTGSTVKNLSAFRVLHSSILRCANPHTCSLLLHAVRHIWSWDKANFFLLEWTLQALAQVAECVWSKPAPVAAVFFQMLELVVLQLSYIPHETVRKVQSAVEQDLSSPFTLAALESLRRLTLATELFCDILRDSGMLDVLLAKLKKQAKTLRKSGVGNVQSEQNITAGMLALVAALVQKSVKNTVCIRDSGMVPYIKIFVDGEMFRGPTLTILEQMSQMNPEEYMSTIIGALCSSTQAELNLKQDLLRSMVKVLENPNSWTAFRTAGGFTGLLSTLVDVDSTLGPRLELPLLTLRTLAVAVHVHPANEHAFTTAGLYHRLAEALLQLDCLARDRPAPVMLEEERGSGRSFQQFVDDAERGDASIPASLGHCIRLLSCLHDFATGVCAKAEEEEDEEGGTSVTSSSFMMDICHPGAICVIMTVLPKVFHAEDPQLSTELQVCVLQHVLSLVQSEPSRQVVCEAGMLQTLLTHWPAALAHQDQPLHLPVIRMFEKLASQAIDASSLRQFLCLGEPRTCTSSAAGHTDGSQSQDSTYSLPSRVPLHRLVSLVSMTTPRTFLPHRLSTTPSFVEFDMSASGYGCLFLPSMATVKGVNADTIQTGGIGGDCRGFPPSAGLSFSCWFMIRRASTLGEAHPLRLLTVLRHTSRAELHFVCLSVHVCTTGRSLLVSTEEEPFQFLDMMEPEDRWAGPLPATARFPCPKQLHLSQWHHLVVVLAKDMKKSCRVSIYLDGAVIGTSKMKYIQPFPGQCVSMDPTTVIDVCGIIGTPALWKQCSPLTWRAGPAYLFEEALSRESVEIMYNQGTRYTGNYQSLQAAGVTGEQCHLRLIPEERVSFGINPAVASITNIAEIRDLYNEVDSRLIAKELGVTSRDNYTPVYLARNISQHLSGTARTIGAALVGHAGVRTFVTRAAAQSFLYIGGPAVLLSLVAMATDDSSLYAGVKVLVSVLSSSPCMEQEMQRLRGYKLLAFLLKAKAHMLSSRTFQLLLYMVGTLELGQSSVSISNLSAFAELLCDFEVWKKAPEQLDLQVLNHFADILKSSSEDSHNAKVMHSLNVMSRLLFLLNEPSVTCQRVSIIITVIQLLIKGYFNSKDICRLGLFLIHTLQCYSPEDENTVASDAECDLSSQAQSSTPARTMWIRNQLLGMMLSWTSSDTALPVRHQEEMFMALGPDWFLLFLYPHLHSSTVLCGTALLSRCLAQPRLLSHFRDGVPPGALVERMKDEPPIILANLKVHSWPCEGARSLCPGFDVLPKLLIHHINVPQVYGVLAALLMHKASFTCLQGQQDLDDILQGVIDSPDTCHGMQLCADVAVIFLELVKSIVNEPPVGPQESWEMLYPGSVMQFFCLVHSLYPEDPLWLSADFLQAVAATVFPPDHTESVDDHALTEDDPEAPPPRATHPARTQVCDFIRILLTDSLVNVPPRTRPHPFVLLLEFSPDTATVEQKQNFQTEMLEFFMDITHVTCREEDSKNQKTQADKKVTVLMDNIAFFSKKMVEKLYMGMFAVEPEKLLVFIVEQIVLVMEKAPGQKEKTVSILYNSANRALLYFLSRPRQSRAQQQTVVGTLQVLLQQWDIILATYNANMNFITCLLHCLLIIKSGSYIEGFGCETNKKQSKKTWYHIFPHKHSHTAVVGEAADTAEVESQLHSLVECVWARLLAERRAELEEAYKLDISVKSVTRETPVSMCDVSPLWEETALKAWQLFSDSQKKKLSRAQQKKLNVLSAAVRQAQKRLSKDYSCTVQEYLASLEACRKTAQEMFDSFVKLHIQTRLCEDEQNSQRWMVMEESLLRERGLFGPGAGVFLHREWIQHGAEGPNRTRPKIRRKALRHSKKWQGFKQSRVVKCNPVEENKGREDEDSESRVVCETGQEAEENGLDCERLTFFPTLSEAVPNSEEKCLETQIILQELSQHEEVKEKLSVVMVSGHLLSEGIVLFGKAHLYICEGFTLSGDGEVYCTQHHPTRISDSFLYNMISKETETRGPACTRCPYEEIKHAHFMRFLLEDNALEIFMHNGRSTFLVFQNKEHIVAFKRLCSVVPSLKGRSVTETVNNMRKPTGGGDKTALHKWQKGEMSNFEYLMHLNTLAGRTYNDLMQYPVFPWVIADYHSQTLDLTSASAFRDLSKPMGAQTDKRKEKFIQRYNEVENNDGDLSAQCHYCTHYSSAIIVASFLVRIQPFSQTYLALQGGCLDVPDRMFHCVGNEWESASRDNMSDVRELIPEFYYLPDFLLNSNNMELGCMQDGTRLGDVVLPPWAKSDPHEFVRINREALESDYVSAHLHLWIDLIFGFKQHGPAAVEALNTFHPYFYADKLEVENMKDPLKKSTILGFVSNFGQIPKQLFTKPHPSRISHKTSAVRDSSALVTLTPFFFHLDKVKPSVQPVKDVVRGPVGHIVFGEKEILAVEKNRLLMPPHFNITFCWGLNDNTCAFSSYGAEKSMAVCEGLTDWGETVCAACPNGNTIVTAGSSGAVCVWDVSFSKDKLKHMKLKQVLYGHTHTVTCLAASQVYSVIVSGSRDRTCILWDLEELNYITQLPGHTHEITALAINELTGEIVSCAGTHLYLWSMRGHLLCVTDTETQILCCCLSQKYEWDARNVIVTGSADGIIQMWRTEYSRTQLCADEWLEASPGSAGEAWQRHLRLCEELNRSLLVSRRRYRNNPPVTALTVSRNHNMLLMGDAWGRVYTWTCEI